MKNEIKKGDKVVMTDCFEADFHKGEVWEVVSDPWEVCGSLCVLLEGYSGGFDVECLTKVVEG